MIGGGGVGIEKVEFVDSYDSDGVLPMEQDDRDARTLGSGRFYLALADEPKQYTSKVVVTGVQVDPENPVDRTTEFYFGRFWDNSDGTVTDHKTGLMWEKKEFLDEARDYSNPHDADNRYEWTATFGGTDDDGTAFTDFLDKMNNHCDDDVATPCTTHADCGGASNDLCGHAGHSDWRLPEVDRDGGREELETLLLEPCTTFPCIDPIFGPTQDSLYWSSTTDASYPFWAWYVGFDDDGVDGVCKCTEEYVRAVRGGL